MGSTRRTLSPGNTAAHRALPHYRTIETAGADKDWLVMVHGASQHLGIFCSQVEAFQGRYRILLIDLPGHGGSESIVGPYGLVEYAGSVRAVLDHIGVRRMHFWGTHTGAGVGLLLATGETGSRFKSMILDGAVLPGVDLPSVGAALSRARATARSGGIEAARREWFDTAGWFEVMRTNPTICRAAEHWSIIAGFAGGPWLDELQPEFIPSIEGRLSSVKMPILLINGEHDLADFSTIAKRLAALLPDARQYEVPRGGGFPLWEFPHEVNARVSDFLRLMD